MRYIRYPDKFDEEDEGVIMMETLLVLPVYLVVLAGIFWLGELCLARQSLTTAEQLRLWERGTRYPNLIQIDTAHIFWNFPAATSVRSAMTTGVDGLEERLDNNTTGFGDTPTDSLGWGTMKNGFLRLNPRRSAWSWGIVDIIIGSLWRDSLGPFSEEDQVRSGRDVMTMLSRTDANGNPLARTMLFRREMDGGTRWEETPYSGDPPLWNSIYLEKWDNFGSFGPPVKFGGKSAQALSAYGERNESFNNWSDL